MPGTYKGLRVASVSITGLDDDIASDLKRGLALSQSRGFLGAGRPALYEDVFDEDIRRCVLFLAQRGYPYATIDAVFTARAGGISVDIILRINPGPPVTVASVDIDGVPPSLIDRATDHVTLRAGQVCADAAANEATTAIRSLLKNNGYADATVEARLDWRDSIVVDVRFAATPGRRYRFGDKVVSGARDDLVPLVRKSMETETGQWYSPHAVQRSRDNLRLLDLFRQARVRTRPVAGDTLDVTAELIEREPQLLETGVGYWTDDLIRGRARWMHRNLFRRGRGVSVGASASAFLQKGNVSVWWPALIGPRTRATASYRIEHQDEDSYNLLRSGVDVNLTYHFSMLTTARAGVEVSNVDLDVTEATNAELDIEDGRLTVLSLRLGRTAADDRLYPSRGTVSWLDILWAPPGQFASDNHFISVEASGTVYRPLGRSVVLAMRAKAGAVEPIAESIDVLPNYRFVSGGASSMRGFKRRRLGPRDADDSPIGGETKIEAAAELRFPLVWRFRGAIFVDAGQVWERSSDTDLADLSVAVGPGLRLATPVGPVRFDLGYRSTDIYADEPRWVFHLSIGPAF